MSDQKSFELAKEKISSELKVLMQKNSKKLEKSRRNLLNKWFQDSVKNYFLELYAAPLIQRDLQCTKVEQVKQIIHNNIHKKDAKFMVIILNYYKVLEQFDKIKLFKEKLIEVILSTLETIPYNSEIFSYYDQKQIRKQFVALILFIYCECREKGFVPPSFYELWNIAFPEEQLFKKKASKYDIIRQRCPYIVSTTVENSEEEIQKYESNNGQIVCQIGLLEEIRETKILSKKPLPNQDSDKRCKYRIVQQNETSRYQKILRETYFRDIMANQKAKSTINSIKIEGNCNSNQQQAVSQQQNCSLLEQKTAKKDEQNLNILMDASNLKYQFIKLDKIVSLGGEQTIRNQVIVQPISGLISQNLENQVKIEDQNQIKKKLIIKQNFNCDYQWERKEEFIDNLLPIGQIVNNSFCQQLQNSPIQQFKQYNLNKKIKAEEYNQQENEEKSFILQQNKQLPFKIKEPKIENNLLNNNILPKLEIKEEGRRRSGENKSSAQKQISQIPKRNEEAVSQVSTYKEDYLQNVNKPPQIIKREINSNENNYLSKIEYSQQCALKFENNDQEIKQVNERVQQKNHRVIPEDNSCSGPNFFSKQQSPHSAIRNLEEENQIYNFQYQIQNINENKLNFYNNQNNYQQPPYEDQNLQYLQQHRFGQPLICYQQNINRQLYCDYTPQQINQQTQNQLNPINRQNNINQQNSSLNYTNTTYQIPTYYDINYHQNFSTIYNQEQRLDYQQNYQFNQQQDISTTN